MDGFISVVSAWLSFLREVKSSRRIDNREQTYIVTQKQGRERRNTEIGNRKRKWEKSLGGRLFNH